MIGSKGFIESAYKMFEDKITKKERKAHKIPLNLPVSLYSIQRLNRIWEWSWRQVDKACPVPQTTLRKCRYNVCSVGCLNIKIE